jgi:hypothetical protein
MNQFTCRSCEASRTIDGVLICRILQQPAVKICRWFAYEPGTDENER